MPHHKSFNHNYCNILQYGYNVFSKGEREREGLILGSPRLPVRPRPEKEAQSLKLKLAVGTFRSMGSTLLSRSDDTEISIRATDSVLNNRITGKIVRQALAIYYTIPEEHSCTRLVCTDQKI